MKKIKKYIKQFFEQQNEILLLSRELEWAHVYHDSIRGINWLEGLSINVGRWAGNYAFFYVLNRILKDVKPNNILEFGLGESTKFILAFLINDLKNTNHLVVEHDFNWKQLFINNNFIPSNTEIVIYPINKRLVNGFESNSYANIENSIKNKFDLYLIDGPFGSEKFSRYDIVFLANNFNVNDEFIIVFDDYNRLGEQQTIIDLLRLFNEKGIVIHQYVYSGIKSVLVIATNKYKLVCSL